MGATCQTQPSHFWQGEDAAKNQKKCFNHGAGLPFGRLIKQRPICPRVCGTAPIGASFATKLRSQRRRKSSMGATCQTQSPDFRQGEDAAKNQKKWFQSWRRPAIWSIDQGTADIPPGLRHSPNWRLVCDEIAMSAATQKFDGRNVPNAIFPSLAR